MRGPSGFSLHLETSEGQAPKGHVTCNHPHVQGHKGLKRPDAGLTSHSKQSGILCTHRLPLVLQGLRDSEPEDFLKLFIDPNEVYCSGASASSDSGRPSEDPGRPDRPPAPQAPSPPALYEVVYEAGALERTQGEAGPAVGFISLQPGQCSWWKGDSGLSGPALVLGRGVFPACASSQALLPWGVCPSSPLLLATCVSLRSAEPTTDGARCLRGLRAAL